MGNYINLVLPGSEGLSLVNFDMPIELSRPRFCTSDFGHIFIVFLNL